MIVEIPQTKIILCGNYTEINAPRTEFGVMEFIELTGKTLLDVINEGEVDFKQLHDAGLNSDSIVRINRFGEIELRNKSEWTLVGGLIGNFEERLRKLTGLDWA